MAKVARFTSDEDGIVIETSDGLRLELIQYSVWAADGDKLPDVRDDAVQRRGRWVVCLTRVEPTE